MSKMLIAGCSNAAGSEIDGTCDSIYNRQHSFGNVLANMLGYEPINIAVSGSANSGIVRSVIDWVNNNHDPKENLVVLVGWSDSNRMEVPFYQPTQYKQEWDNYVDWYSDTHDAYIRINIGYKGNGSKEQEFIDGYHRFMVNNALYLEILSANYVLQLQYFLKMHKIKYLFVNTLTMFAWQEMETSDWYKGQIDNERFLNFNDNTESFYYKYINLGYKNVKAEYYHHDEIPHKLYAEYLHNYITEKGLL